MEDTRQSGSSLLLVVLILLVLSGFGVAVLTLTDSDRTEVSTDDHLKDAFYVAEMGLRVGESTLLTNDPSEATPLMQHISVAQTAAVDPQVPTFPETQTGYTLGNLGTYLVNATGQELANQAFSLPTSTTGKTNTRAFYSLYVRNNPADTSVSDGTSGTSARVDTDETVNLVSVGWVSQGGRILSVKVLEEEYAWRGLAAQLIGQKGIDESNTNSVQFGGN